MPFTEWLPRWWESLRWPFSGVVLAIVLLAPFRLAYFLIRRPRRPSFERLALHATVWAGALFWFFTAPAPRFGWGFVVLLALLLALPLLAAAARRLPPAALAALLLAALAWEAWQVRGWEPDAFPAAGRHALVPADYPRPLTRRVTLGGIPVHVPVENDQCWHAPVPLHADPRPAAHAARPRPRRRFPLDRLESIRFGRRTRVASHVRPYPRPRPDRLGRGAAHDRLDRRHRHLPHHLRHGARPAARRADPAGLAGRRAAHPRRRAHLRRAGRHVPARRRALPLPQGGLRAAAGASSTAGPPSWSSCRAASPRSRSASASTWASFLPWFSTRHVLLAVPLGGWTWTLSRRPGRGGRSRSSSSPPSTTSASRRGRRCRTR